MKHNNSLLKYQATFFLDWESNTGKMITGRTLQIAYLSLFVTFKRTNIVSEKMLVWLDSFSNRIFLINFIVKKVWSVKFKFL